LPRLRGKTDDSGRGRPDPAWGHAGPDFKRLIILGDFFHTRHSQCAATLAALRRWRSKRPDLAITLIRGNHDAHAGDPPADLGITCVAEPFDCGPFVLSHHGIDPGDRYGISGHLHPAVALSDATSRLRAPCFWFNDTGLVLPAFGSFTGCCTIRPRPGDRVFAIGGGEVVEVPVPALGAVR
jgi:DNA ligase-associated metallophosphoesterase